MNYEQCTFSQEPEAESSPISSSATRQLSLLSGSHTAAKSSESALPMDGFPTCKCGKGTLGCSIHPNTKGEWIASMQDSLARILVSQEVRLALVKVRALDFTGKYSGLPMRFDLISSSWKMSQQSLLETEEQCSEQSLAILPHVALMRSGRVYPLPKLALRTSETDGGVLPGMKPTHHVPTPTAQDYIERKSTSKERLNFETNKSVSLDRLVKNRPVQMWATPRANQGMAASITEKTAAHRHPNLEVMVAREMFPTPQARDYRTGDDPSGRRAQRKREQGWSQNLNDIVRMFPTPAARDYKGGRKLETLEAAGRKPTNSLPDMVNHQNGDTGKLNPRWVEWLMGWPIGHTSSKHWATAKSRFKRQQPSQSSGE